MSFYDYIVDDLFSSITLFGSPVFYIVLVLILFKFDVAFAFKLFISLIFIEFICIFIKLVYYKERPNPQSRKEFFSKIDANSFPSVHSARISMIVTMLVLHFKSMLIFCIGALVIIGVSYSRMYLKRHYFIDVLVGVFVGIIIAVITTWVI